MTSFHMTTVDTLLKACHNMLLTTYVTLLKACHIVISLAVARAGHDRPIGWLDI